MRVFYQKMRQVEASLEEAHVVVISMETPDGGRAGVAAEVSKGIAQASLESGVPILFGVLTTDTLEQAVERAGSKSGNKGYAAAEAALEMVNLLKEMGV